MASPWSCATQDPLLRSLGLGRADLRGGRSEKYSRRLSERITEGYAAKFDQEHDPGGHAGLGFRRLPAPPHTLEIDPERMPLVVGLFERYALGNVSATQLEAETGLAATRIRMILMNPLYDGWIRRGRRARGEGRAAPHPGRSSRRKGAAFPDRTNRRL